MSVQFTNNSAAVKAALDAAVKAYLYEAGGELEAQTKRNTRPVNRGKHDVKNSWGYKVDESKGETKVGSPLEASYWEEFGTGEHALYKNGRKGWWVYVEGNDTPRANQKRYTEKEAKQVAAFMRSQGLDAHATNGTEPNRPLFKAFTSLKSALIRRAETVLKARVDE